jgi:hypothetical protein
MSTAAATYSKIALKLAIEAKSCRLEHDLVSVVCDAMGGFLVDEAFDALVDEVEAALPFARFDRRRAGEWERAGCDCRAEAINERRQLGFGA